MIRREEELEAADRQLLEPLGLIRVTLPLPLWVDHVHCFLAKGDDGWTIIDAGIYDACTEDAWREVLRAHRIGAGDVKQIVVTHNHIDHIGAAGMLQQWTGAPIRMPAIDAKVAQVVWRDGKARTERPHRAFGMEEALSVYIERQRIEQFCSWIHPWDTILPLGEQDTLTIGNSRYRVIPAAGHSDAHVCLFQEDCRLLIAGDALIPPNNPMMLSEDPLETYFDTLRSLANLGAARLVPSHGKPFGRVGIRAGLIAAYRQEQLGTIREWVEAAGTEVTVDDTFRYLQTQGALPDDYFGRSEIYYFLKHLQRQGLLEGRTERRTDVVRFAAGMKEEREQ